VAAIHHGGADTDFTWHIGEYPFVTVTASQTASAFAFWAFLSVTSPSYVTVWNPPYAAPLQGC